MTRRCWDDLGKEEPSGGLWGSGCGRDQPGGNPLHTAVGQDWPDLGGVEGRPGNGSQIFSLLRGLQPTFRTNYIPAFPEVTLSQGRLQNLLWGQGDLPWWDRAGLS